MTLMVALGLAESGTEVSASWISGAFPYIARLWPLMLLAKLCVMLLMGLIIFGTTQFIPQLLQEVLGYTATNAGLALTMGGLATLLVMPLAGFLSTRADPRLLVGFALAMQGVALWNLSTLNSQISFHDAAVARMIQSVALPFLFVTITNIAYVGIGPRENNQASALMNVSRNLGGTFGISLVQTMLARQSQVHQSQYVESLNPLNPNYTKALSGIARQLAANGISQAHRNYLAAGGYGFIIGDGKLNYGTEMLAEFYYKVNVSKNIAISPGYQFIVNPAYNKDRGPVNVFSIRLHVEF